MTDYLEQQFAKLSEAGVLALRGLIAAMSKIGVPVTDRLVTGLAHVAANSPRKAGRGLAWPQRAQDLPPVERRRAPPKQCRPRDTATHESHPEGGSRSC